MYTSKKYLRALRADRHLHTIFTFFLFYFFVFVLFIICPLCRSSVLHYLNGYSLSHTIFHSYTFCFFFFFCLTMLIHFLLLLLLVFFFYINIAYQTILQKLYPGIMYFFAVRASTTHRGFDQALILMLMRFFFKHYVCPRDSSFFFPFHLQSRVLQIVFVFFFLLNSFFHSGARRVLT